jgi:hypothetical protein
MRILHDSDITLTITKYMSKRTIGMYKYNSGIAVGAVTGKELLPYTIICDTVAQIPTHQSIPTRWLLEMPLVATDDDDTRTLFFMTTIEATVGAKYSRFLADKQTEHVLCTVGSPAALPRPTSCKKYYIYKRD